MTSAPLEPNRRHSQRIAFDAPCELHQGESAWTTRVLDISLRGALLERPANWVANLSQPFEVTIALAPQESAIIMSLDLRHVGEQQLGFYCRYIDLDSAAHLKRLVELNLGDETLLNRELSALGTLPEDLR
ncbi:MAG: PilZ domain-containing protein [Gammaproteobacteria bacterium]|nr:PilZ domain-containing protein [Gammaproteobacteria bacterium]